MYSSPPLDVVFFLIRSPLMKPVVIKRDGSQVPSFLLNENTNKDSKVIPYNHLRTCQNVSERVSEWLNSMSTQVLSV